MNRDGEVESPTSIELTWRRAAKLRLTSAVMGQARSLLVNISCHEYDTRYGRLEHICCRHARQAWIKIISAYWRLAAAGLNFAKILVHSDRQRSLQSSVGVSNLS